MKFDVVTIVAGPAGLTAGLELVRAGSSRVLIVESDGQVGGLSRTVRHNGNRIDIGGHRFFSKSDWVMDWWRELLPVALPAGTDKALPIRIAYQGSERLIGAVPSGKCEDDDDVMLIRNRVSRIYFGGQFFDYPLKRGVDTALKLGIFKTMAFAASYLRASATSAVAKLATACAVFLFNFAARKATLFTRRASVGQPFALSETAAL